MSAPTYQKIKHLFLEARALEGSERRAFLEAHCGAEPELRAEVEALLREAETLGDFLAAPAKLGPEPPPSAHVHPERIGAYRVVRLLGHGGMGVVYLAEQESPKRLVALKLLRYDHVSRRQIERFGQESELLGRLNHPGIARIYESGWAETETGRRPYFAMEHVEGRALHEFVTAQRLELPAKVRLVSQIAEAVHYAHERGVVHRDLKPSNVLLDDRGEPKVLDFGVARPLGESSSGTQTGQLVGTLAYMSPEQAAGRSEVDARSDVYSLGVMLYELLTGRLPVATEGLPLHEAVRRVREEEPIGAGAVRGELEGDLETILSKALAKEPEQRYASAAEFAEDLRLTLDHRPIRARRPTMLYVAWKLVRRHRLLASLAVALFLVSSAAQFGWLLLRDRGREVERQQAELERQERANSFFRDLLARSRLLDEVEHVRHQGELYVAGTASPAQLEAWIADAARVSERLEQYWQELEALQAWADRAEEPESIALPEQKEYALEVQQNIVQGIESMNGPRGPLPILRGRLERLLRAPASGEERP